MTTDPAKPCPYCGHQHAIVCPGVRAIEYDTDRASVVPVVRRVEFHPYQDYMNQPITRVPITRVKPPAAPPGGPPCPSRPTCTD
jgi:hypothetical protein